MFSDTSYPWHVLRVSTRLQAIAASYLAHVCETFNPVRISTRHWSRGRTTHIETPLLASYLFCRFDWNAQPERAYVMQAPGVRGILLSETNGPPAWIDPSEIERLRDLQTIPDPPKVELLQKGDRIVIVLGPFVGVETEIAWAGENKVKAMVPMFNAPRETEFLREYVRPLAVK